MIDEERIERALRQGPPGEPEYIAGRAHVGFDVGPAMAIRPSRPTVGRSLAGSLQFAAVIVVAVVVGGAFLLRSQSAPQVGSDGDLLSQVQATGRLRIAVRPDSPQSTLRGSLAGFDVEVANELARRLGLIPELIVIPAADMLDDPSEPSWDLAMPSTSLLRSTGSEFSATQGYYYWPIHVLVPADSTFGSVSDLAGRATCAIAGSSGEAWLGGRFDAPSATSVGVPPANVQIRPLATDAACLEDVASGRSAAMVAAALSDADLATRSDVVPLGAPAFTEERSMIAHRLGLAPDRLISEINAALSAMRSDGTLSELSRRRFGGADLSSPPAPNSP